MPTHDTMTSRGFITSSVIVGETDTVGETNTASELDTVGKLVTCNESFRDEFYVNIIAYELYTCCVYACSNMWVCMCSIQYMYSLYAAYNVCTSIAANAVK